MKNLTAFTRHALLELKQLYDENEIRSICHIIFIDLFKFTKIDIHIKKDDILPASFSDKFIEIVEKLKTGMPIQYLVGEADFCGLRFEVNPSTLIPRPETAELVQWAGQSAPPHARILDIGTGSGCIAISIAAQRKDARIDGVDISAEAIATARRNALRHRTDVRFEVRDILQHELYTWDDYDLIASNPPYIRQSEAADMTPNVLDFEPHTALFVPDEDPLLFYRAISAFASKHLNEGGQLFFEINEALGKETADMMASMGFNSIEIRHDFYDKPRMIKGEKHD